MTMLIKSAEDIKNLKESGKLIGEILANLEEFCRPGISTHEVDKEAERLIRKSGGLPAFKNYRTHVSDRPFPGTICASLNSELVHGIPRKDVILKDGDIFTIDIGMQWPGNKGVFTDTAITVPIGKIPDKVARLLDVTKKSLEIAIKSVLPGRSVAGVGKEIEAYIRSAGSFGIVRDLVGHGVGHAIHEEPSFPIFYDKRLEKVKFQPGMVVAIEPMISLGDWQVRTKDDGWTIVMADDSLCAHFEHTIIITEEGNVVATRRPGEK